MAKLKYATTEEFLELYKKFPGGTEQEFADFLEEKGYGNFKGVKYNTKDLETRRRRQNLKTKAPAIYSNKPMSDFFKEAKTLDINTKGLTDLEKKKKIRDKRGNEVKKGKRLTVEGFSEKENVAKKRYVINNPEKKAASDLKYRQRINEEKRIPPPAKNAKQALFRDLWSIAKDGKGTLELKALDKDLDIFKAKNFYSNKNKIIDIENKVQYNFNNLENKLNKKNVGKNFKDIISPYDQKYFVSKPAGLRTQINTKMIPGYTPASKLNYLEVQHIEGRNVNPYNVHITTGKENKIEGNARSKFERAWKFSEEQKLKDKNYDSLKAKKNAFKMFKDSIDETSGIESKPTMATRGDRVFGSRETLSNILRSTKEQGVVLPRGILKEADTLFENIKKLNKPDLKKACRALGAFNVGGDVAGCAAAVEADPIKAATALEEIKPTSAALGKVRNAASAFLKFAGKGKVFGATAAVGVGAGALVKKFMNDDPSTYLTNDAQANAMILDTIDEKERQERMKAMGDAPELLDEARIAGEVGVTAAAIPGSGAVYGARKKPFTRMVDGVKKTRPAMGTARAALGPVGKALSGFATPAGIAALTPLNVASSLYEGDSGYEIATDPLNYLAPAFAGTLSKEATRGMGAASKLSKVLRLGMSPGAIKMVSRRFGLPGLALSGGISLYELADDYKMKRGMFGKKE